MTQKSKDVDVLIVGAGPAGLMLATWLSKLKINTRIIDKRSTKVFTGQADGIQCRTVEVFQSFGFAEKFIKEASHINEVVFWNPGEKDESGGIVRTKRTSDNEPGTSRFPHGVLTQGRIERFMLDGIKESNGLEVERSIEPIDMVLDPSSDLSNSSYPIKVTLRHLSEEESTPATVGSVAATATTNGLFRSNLLSDDEYDAASKARTTPGLEETFSAKYVVGCDGARSWVRKHIGLSLQGDSANVYWGVLDIAPITNFPDIRLKCTIHSKDSGSILVVPRERGLVRLYVQLGTTAVGERVDRSAISPETILATARRIIAPYTLEAPEVDWWTVYEIGQRICNTVTNDERIFIAGDAFHTHSPKMGQGMNVSMMDTYNLGWKLANVIKGRCDPSILKTYQSERHQTAKELIELDYKISTMFGTKPAENEDDPNGVSLIEFNKFFKSLGAWASGTACHYRSSTLVSSEGNLDLPGLPVGMRFKSYQVVSVADARPWHIGDLLVSDGRFRIIIFAGDQLIPAQKERLSNLAAYLDTKDGPIKKYTADDQDIDSVIEVLTIVSNPRTSQEPNDYPDNLWPAKLPHGCRDYNKIFSDDDSWFSGHGKAYESLGIDPSAGCVVIVRPDQYVAAVTTLDDYASIGKYFGNFMLDA